MDIRSEKTHQKIRDGLLAALDEEQLDSITVSLVCQKAGVNRSTFYVYYSNVGEVFLEIEDGILGKMEERLKHCPKPTFEAFINIYLDLARENRTVFRTIHEYNIYQYSITRMYELAKKYFGNDFRNWFEESALDFYFYFSGYFGLIRYWIEQGCRESNEEILQVLNRYNSFGK